VRRQAEAEAAGDRLCLRVIPPRQLGERLDQFAEVDFALPARLWFVHPLRSLA
jgi:hypothetical protein